jgi:hypothetical protein
MAKLFSNEPLFVDLFYGVVVGSAIALMSLVDLEKLFFQIVWVFAVLEDWFMYYRHVVDTENKRISYTFKSLLFEFGILLVWFLGFQALKEDKQEHYFLLFFSLFYLIKVIAGVSFYSRHSMLMSRRMLYDSFWLVLPLAAWSISHFGNALAFAVKFWIVTGITIIVLVTWWLFMHFAPPRPPRHASAESTRTQNAAAEDSHT